MIHKMLLRFAVFALLGLGFQPALPAQGKAALDRAGTPATADACTGAVKNTPSFSFAYGTVLLNGADAPAGTVVWARSPRGEVVGCAVVIAPGNYGAMFVYGEDTSVTPAVPGMREGEGVRFFVNELPAMPSPSIAWQNDKEIHPVHLTAPVAVNADFTATPVTGVGSLSVQFTDVSTPAPTSWAWDFGDGGTSTEQHPLHSYAIPGTYAVSLSIATDFGAGVKTRSGLITVYRQVEPAFHASLTSGPAPLTVSFTNDSTGDFTTLSWDFGDGTTSDQANPVHRYEREGRYTVVLTVSGPGGSVTKTEVAYITVQAPEDPPSADFSADRPAGRSPLTVRFTNRSTGAGELTYRWDFGDGSPLSTETNPVHTFTSLAPKTFTVRLTVTGNGKSSVKELHISVTPALRTIYLPVAIR